MNAAAFGWRARAGGRVVREIVASKRIRDAPEQISDTQYK